MLQSKPNYPHFTQSSSKNAGGDGDTENVGIPLTGTVKEARKDFWRMAMSDNHPVDRTD